MRRQVSRAWWTLWLALFPTEALAGPWARRAGSFYLRAGFARFEGQGAFLLANNATAGQFVGLAGELYGEAGLGRHFELDLSARYVENRHERADGRVMSNAGPEDLELTLKWSPLPGAMPVAFTLGARAAMYERLAPEALSDGSPQRGPGGFDLLTGASWGVSFWPTRAWLVADVQHRLRFGGASNGVRLRVEGGGFVIRRVGGALVAEFQAAYGREQQQPPGAPAPVPRVLGLGAKLFVDVYAGLGVSSDFMWLPDVFNDGAGWRVGLSLTWERR